jgi:hypothetical protein
MESRALDEAIDASRQALARVLMYQEDVRPCRHDEVGVP